MADETDFLDLYGKLRLQPDCSVAEFKQAYRRHVSQWHPDRRSRGAHADALVARRLQRLMAQYSAAMEFHKQHGRLPGAAAPRIAPAVSSNIVVFVPRPAAAESVEPAGTPTAAEAGAEPAPERHGARKLAWLATLVVAGALVWMLVPETENPEAPAEGVPIVSADVALPAVNRGMLDIGMKDDEVVALEGEPTLRSADRWEYGPSWVRFEGGAVVDWYSSPLRTLHVHASHPSR
ncbi:J domain-containing protein [Luteibacter pinisoli]|uniref:J domain-containing protein n=1 Tax=Luteibacter pinisoli TaxID=2589080 RepID=A0A4Y5Z2W4_9GAMM|nr:J domain-containing protein [Luteibacter pinisoli]QDE39374.1 J domain-containing protein [Luteibacter pinisoli]